MSTCPECGGPMTFYAWGAICGITTSDDTMVLGGCGHVEHNDVLQNVYIDDPKVVCTASGCDKKGYVYCRYCKAPTCTDHANETLDGIVCDGCYDRVPEKYR